MPLPPAVAVALEGERSIAHEGRAPVAGPNSGRALALVPVFVLVTLAALLFPRPVPPQEFPLPAPDGRVLAEAARGDAELAQLAARGLSDDARVLGSELRRFNRLQLTETDESTVIAARAALNRAIAAVMASHPGDLKPLRAAELAIFQRAVADFERTGVESEELTDIAGTFVPRLREVGWIQGNTVLPDTTVRAVLFKATWVATLNLAGDPALEPSLDELRALYAFYILHPHPSDARRLGIENARRAAQARRDSAACEEVRAAEAAATEEWRLDKLRRLGTIDPEYPLSFALGVSHYRQRRYAAATEAFRDWLRAHPDGPLALRAQNHLKAALAADSP